MTGQKTVLSLVRSWPTLLRFLSLAGAVSLPIACGQAPVKSVDGSIVSTTLCADGYVHAIPDLTPRLAALSWQSRSTLSATPEWLKSLPQTSPEPEQALIWKDAFRVSSGGGGGDVDLTWGENFEIVWQNLGELSDALNVEDPSEALKTRLQNLTPPKIQPKILYLNRSGATAGPGTFVDAVIRAAGGVNLVETPGWQSPDTETLVQYSPDIILTSFMGSDYSGVNDRAIQHAALAKKIDSLPKIDIPGKLWPCAGPGLIDATEELSKAMADL